MLDQAFIVAICLSILSLAQLALRPHQLAQLQDSLETWTLNLDTFLPTYPQLLHRCADLSRFYVFVIAVFVMFIGAVVLFSADSGFILAGWGLIIFSVIIASASGLWQYATEILEDVNIKDVTLRNPLSLIWLLTKSFLLVVTMQLVGGFFILLLFFNRKMYFKLQAFPAVISTVTVVYIFLLVTFPILKFVLGLLWRLVEHASGAWAAILIVVSGVLGLVKVFIE